MGARTAGGGSECVGTYLVDRAMRASAKMSADLVQVPTEVVLAEAIGSDAGTLEH
jgi:hypothetical protein